MLAESVYAEEPIGFAEVVLGLLGKNKATVAVAESCTGGLMTDMLTDVPGSSDALHVGVTAYANGNVSQKVTIESIEANGGSKTVEVSGFRPGELDETAEVSVTAGPVE